MKYIVQMVFLLFALISASCGQTTKNTPAKTPVALGKIYQLPPDTDGVVPNTNPPLTTKLMNDYIMIIQWHFEMHFTDTELREYKEILIADWNKDETARTNIKNASIYADQLRAKSLSDINSEQYSRKSQDIMDGGYAALIDNWKPTSLRGNIKKQAAEGEKECVFLWNKINDYEKPIGEGKVFVSNFSKKYIDAAAEWIAYKINVVANKQLIVLDEEKRAQMGKMILEAWNKEQAEKKIEYDWGNIEGMLSEASTYWNYLRLTKKFSLDSYITNYNKLSTVADWGKQVLFFCPAVKPYAEQRIKELQDYAAKMSDAEWQLEFQRLNMEANMSKQILQQMKNDMVRSHVLMLNIIEGDNRWEVRETKTY